MKIDITFDHEDLLNFIGDILAVRGLKPAGPVLIQREKSTSKTQNRYQIKVTCDAAEPPITCMTCGGKLITPAVAAVAEIPSRIQSNTQPSPVTAGVTLDTTLGESLVPPYGELATIVNADAAVKNNIQHEDKDNIKSIAVLRAQSDSIKQQKERERGRRK